MNKVVMYSTASCPYCAHAKELLDSEKVTYEEIRVDLDEKKRAYMEKISGRRTVPQIFIGDKHVGGFDDLKALYERGELNAWLNR
jgi:glutaredoxin 3